MSRQRKSGVLAAVVCLAAYISNVRAEEPVIVLAPNAAETERFAAEELQSYLDKIIGRKVPIRASLPTGAMGLLVGGGELDAGRRAELGEEGYTLLTTDRGVVLAGAGPRGTLYAVYEFLHRLGCRWYFIDPEDEIVPRLDLAEVIRLAHSEVQVVRKPDFPVRMHRFLVYDLGPEGTQVSAAVMNGLPSVIDWLAKNRINIFQFGLDHNLDCHAHWPHYRAVFGQMRKRGLTIGVGGHCMFMFMPPEEFKQHPDWFPMVNGKRQPSGQFCTRNEQAVHHYLDNLIRFLNENLEIEYFAPWPNDTGGWCECPSCKDTPSADRFMELGQRIFGELNQAVPRVRVTHFAYGSHMTPPEKERPLPGMTLTLCTWGRDLSVPFADERTGQRFQDTFADWGSICREAGTPLILHEKYARHLGLGFHPLPLPTLQEDCRWLRGQGLAGFELPCGFMGRRTKSFNLYVLARLMWDVDTDVAAVVEDYFQRCYGEAAGPMRKAYEAVERAQPDFRYWAHNHAVVAALHPAGERYAPQATTYAAGALECLEAARPHVGRALSLASDDGMRRRINRFAESLAYVHLEWQAVGALIEVARQVHAAEAASDAADYLEQLDAAGRVLQEASELEKQRQTLAQGAPGCGLYWDVTGLGPANVIKASQIEAWRKLLAERRAVDFDARPRRIWQIGIFDGKSSELGGLPNMQEAMRTMPKRVRHEIGPNWYDLSGWPDFPPGHWPASLDHAATIEIVFEADAGACVFTLVQTSTGVRETVTLLLDGRKAGQFTTVAGKQTKHTVPLDLAGSGRHTLTLDEFELGGGYAIDAMKLERPGTPR